MLYMPTWESRCEHQHIKGLRSLTGRKPSAAYSSTIQTYLTTEPAGLHVPHLIPINPTDNTLDIRNTGMFHNATNL